MPTYEYECGNCEARVEEFQSITDPPLKKCPSCGKMRLRRLISGGAAIVFKGSGFYQTDYRSESYKKGAEAEKPAKSDTANKDTVPKDTKPTEKTAAKPAEKKRETP